MPIKHLWGEELSKLKGNKLKQKKENRIDYIHLFYDCKLKGKQAAKLTENIVKNIFIVERNYTN